MPLCDAQDYVLEHFLRVQTSVAEEWLSSFQILTKNPALSQVFDKGSENSEFSGRISFFESSNINLIGAYVNHKNIMRGSVGEIGWLIMVLDGYIELDTMNKKQYRGPWGVYAFNPYEKFEISFPRNSQFLIIKLKKESLQKKFQESEYDESALTNVLRDFIFKSFFFKNYIHASNSVNELSNRLEKWDSVVSFQNADGPEYEPPFEDKRLCNAIRLINSRISTEIDLNKIASDSGMSVRTMYNLMGRFLGMPPYHYALSRRLIKARELIIKSYGQNGGVFRQASKVGFKHPGRFSKYYKQHFFESPTDTLRELKALQQRSKSVRKSFSD